MNQIILVDDFEFHVDQSQEPRISSTLLASKLGYSKRQGLETLANRHKGSLLKLGQPLEVLTSIPASPIPRTCSIPFFNRDQTLYLVAKSEKPVAQGITIQLVRAFRQLEDQLGLKPLVLDTLQANFQRRPPQRHLSNSRRLLQRHLCKSKISKTRAPVGWMASCKVANQDIESCRKRATDSRTLLMLTAPPSAGVYCLLMSDGTIKIGRADNIHKRMKGYLTHQAIAPHYLATLPGTEKEHHAALAEWRIAGEFFVGCVSVVEYIESTLTRKA